MALAIGVSPGSKIRVGSSVVEVQTILKRVAIVIIVGGIQFTITDSQRTEILPDVFVSYGSSARESDGLARLAFEAPREIRITRMGHATF